jgi:hypothetical protein
MGYETTIIPGEGLGDIIRLGESMHFVTSQLMKLKYKLRFNYSNTEFLEAPVIVDIVDVGVRLTFLNLGHQELVLIELLHINDPESSPLKLVYNGVVLNEVRSRVTSECPPKDSPKDSPKVSPKDSPKDSTSSLVSQESSSTVSSYVFSGPSLKSVYNRVFGPTYPGGISGNGYIISYPGISFNFYIAPELGEKLEKLEKEAMLSYLLNWDDDIYCQSIALFVGETWSKFNETDFNNGKTHEPIQNLKIDLSLGKVSVIFKDDTKELIIGETTQQQVLNILGPPDDYFNKFDSRLLIHKHTKGLVTDDDLQVNDISHYKFHNYYKYGIDVLYDLNGKNTKVQSKTTIKKIILHNGGICESLNFMRWNRCNWEAYNDKVRFNSSMTFKDLPESLQNLTPVLLNRNESEYIDNDLDIIHFPKEVTFSQESQLSLNSVDERVKTWGQSKLYGFDRCIFEVLDSNGTISIITVY